MEEGVLARDQGERWARGGEGSQGTWRSCEADAAISIW